MSEKAIRTVRGGNHSRSPAAYLLLLLLIALVYGQILWFTPGKLDEYNILIVNKDLLEKTGTMKEILLTDPFFKKGGDLYRPLQNFSFMADARAGDGAVWVFYLTNLILHAISTVLVFILLNISGSGRRISLFLAAIFAVHPLFVQVTAWLPSRGDLLITATGLLSVIFFIRYLQCRRWSYGILSLFFYTLAIFSKESAIVLPLILGAYYLLMVKPGGMPRGKILLSLALYILPAMAYLYIRVWFAEAHVEPAQFSLLNLFSNLRALPEYLFKFFIPAGLSPMPAYSWLFFAGGLAIAGILAWYASRPSTGKLRELAFGMLWYLVLTGPSLFYTTRFGSAAYDYLEHRSYLPLGGIIIILASLLPGIIERNRIRNVVLYMSVIVGVAAIGAGVYTRVYSAPDSFYDRAIMVNKGSAIAWFNRGVVRMIEKQEYREAMADFDRAIKLRPEDYPEAWLNKGYCLESTGQPEEALLHYRKAALLHREAPEPWLAVALLNENRGEYSASLMAYDSVVVRSPRNAVVWYRRGMLKYRIQNDTGALSDISRAISIRPEFTEALVNRGILKFQMQNMEGALSDLTEAIRLDDRSSVSWLNRGRVYYFMQQYQMACSDWLTAGGLGNEEARMLWEEYCR